MQLFWLLCEVQIIDWSIELGEGTTEEVRKLVNRLLWSSRQETMLTCQTRERSGSGEREKIYEGQQTFSARRQKVFASTCSAIIVEKQPQTACR